VSLFASVSDSMAARVAGDGASDMTTKGRVDMIELGAGEGEEG